MNNILHSINETILLFGLSTAETRLVSTLVSSFAINIKSLTSGELENYLTKFTEIKNYLKAGADDYVILPFNHNQFSVSFLILLEIGQAMAQYPRQEESKASEYMWNRLVNYFQAGESYFSPKSLLLGKKHGHILNKWQQLRRLGLGGFGVVYLVKEIATGKLAVSKTPHSAQINIRVLRSAAILKRLIHHPNIGQLIEVLKHDGKFILIQEYIDGTTLQKLLTTSIAAKDKEKYFLQLLSAIAYSHSHKILHRDIKPENIMINKAGQLKIIAFIKEPFFCPVYYPA